MISGGAAGLRPALPQYDVPLETRATDSNPRPGAWQAGTRVVQRGRPFGHGVGRNRDSPPRLVEFRSLGELARWHVGAREGPVVFFRAAGVPHPLAHADWRTRGQRPASELGRDPTHARSIAPHRPPAPARGGGGTRSASRHMIYERRRSHRCNDRPQERGSVVTHDVTRGNRGARRGQRPAPRLSRSNGGEPVRTRRNRLASRPHDGKASRTTWKPVSMSWKAP